MRVDVTLVSNGIKQLAKELNIPILLVSQLNRDAAKSDRRPRLFDLRESGAIEQDADGVVFVYPEQEIKEDIMQVLVDVAKRRDGGTGERNMMFNKKFTKFCCMEKDENEVD
jgi:replicative DNA helicase